MEPLLASLAHIKSKYNAEEPGEFDISFLEEYIARPEFSSAMKVHNRVIEVSSENGPKPVVSRARSLLDDVSVINAYTQCVKSAVLDSGDRGKG